MFGAQVPWLCTTLCDAMDDSSPGSALCGILQAILEWVAMSSSWDLPNPGITPRSPTLQADSSLSELPGKPKNPGVGSLPLLQGTFPTQGSNWGLLHCRWVLYHLSHPGSPLINESDVIIDITILLLANCKNFDFYVYVDF